MERDCNSKYIFLVNIVWQEMYRTSTVTTSTPTTAIPATTTTTLTTTTTTINLIFLILGLEVNEWKWPLLLKKSNTKRSNNILNISWASPMSWCESITLIELSLINISLHFPHHYDHVTKSPQQNNIHVCANNDAFSIVSSVINLIWFKQQVCLKRYWKEG